MNADDALDVRCPIHRAAPGSPCRPDTRVCWFRWFRKHPPPPPPPPPGGVPDYGDWDDD